MNVLSLFSGIGGLELGLERAGMTVVGQVEIDPFCQRVLAKHWPEVPRHDDVRTTVAWWMGRTRPPVDVVCGGFPCQPVSLAGKRLAQDDERWLWPAAWTGIRDLRPRFAILENVPGLLTRGFGDVLGDLAEIGYDAEWDCIPAAAVGAPHRRDRVFVVAYPGGEPGRLQPESVAGRGGAAIAGHHGAHGYLAHADSEWQPQPGRAVVEERGRVGDGRCQAGGPDVADAKGDRWQAQRQRSSAGHLDWSGQLRRAPATHWQSEPGMGRVADGVPGRLDRLRSLGNAVVPQVAEYIGRLVMAGAA